MTPSIERRIPDGCCLRAMRVDAGLTLGGMAMALGVTPVDVCDWELGRRMPTSEQVDKMECVRMQARREVQP